jgi:hypothetical protein
VAEETSDSRTSLFSSPTEGGRSDDPCLPEVLS